MEGEKILGSSMNLGAIQKEVVLNSFIEVEFHELEKC